MSLFSLEGNSFIISVAFTLLMSGLIVYLMNTKISRLEKNLQNQNHVLTGIINGIQTDLENKQIDDMKKQHSNVIKAKLFGTKIKFLPPRRGERYASALSNMSLSNKVYKRYGKIELKRYIENFLKTHTKP